MYPTNDRDKCGTRTVCVPVLMWSCRLRVVFSVYTGDARVAMVNMVTMSRRHH